MIEPNDPDWTRLQRLARMSRENPEAWLGMGDIFGELGKHAGYAAAFRAALQRVWLHGTRAALSAYVGAAA